MTLGGKAWRDCPFQVREITNFDDWLMSLQLIERESVCHPSNMRAWPILLSMTTSHRWLWNWAYEFQTPKQILFCYTTQELLLHSLVQEADMPGLYPAGIPQSLAVSYIYTHSQNNIHTLFGRNLSKPVKLQDCDCILHTGNIRTVPGGPGRPSAPGRPGRPGGP